MFSLLVPEKVKGQVVLRGQRSQANRLTARQLVSEHRRFRGCGAVPALQSELVLTLGHGEPGPVQNARRQERLPEAQVPLP